MKPTKTTLAEYLERWLKDYAWPNLAPRTAEGYEHIIRRHFIPALGDMILTQLKPEHLQRYYSEKLRGGRCDSSGGLSAQTVRHHHTALHKALETALEWGLLPRNPADAVSPPRVQRPEMRVWSENDISRFLEAAKDTPYYALFYLALFTGMRRSELLALRWQDVDFILSQVYVNRSLRVLKGGKVVFRSPKTAKGRRMVALPPSAILLPDTVTHAWIKLVRRTGLKGIRLHDARHSHASLMLKQGVHPKIVQERLGHASIQITLDTYSHAAPGLQQVAAERFDEAFGTKYNEPENEAIEKIR